ncbi:MAG: phosphatase PAP2 family protein [Myxococcaceae bacterium]|nr:phosphatase PAP2 family protein [Myxococcaceae bacterium]
MISLLTAMVLVTASDHAEHSKAQPPDVVTPDGGTVPTVAPGLTDELAPVLAPERDVDVGETKVATPSLSVYDVDLPLEASLTLSSFGLFAIVDFLIKPTIEGDVSCRRPEENGRCNPADLTAFDRYAVGRNSKEWNTFGDIALFTSLAIPVLYLGLESLVLPTQTPWGDFANDLVIVAEAMALTSMINTVMKFAFRRPRPIRYTDQTFTPFDAELSFPSGHTSIVAAATSALTATVFLRHPDSPMRFVVLGFGIALTTLTGLSRVESGNHFPTDVLIGAMVGSLSGFLVPYMHRKKSVIQPTASYNPFNGATSLGIAGSW